MSIEKEIEYEFFKEMIKREKKNFLDALERFCEDKNEKEYIINAVSGNYLDGKFSILNSLGAFEKEEYSEILEKMSY